MTSGMGRKCAAAVGIALLFFVAGSPAVHADEGGDAVAVVPGSTLPETPGTTLPEEPAPTPPEVTTPVTTPEDPTTGTVTVPDPFQEPQPVAPLESEILFPPLIADDSANPSSEAVPASGDASPTATPSITSEPSTAAVPMALPVPVAKTIDAVVATATGSPLYVQFLTVLVLIGAGIAYFRFLGSKGTRVPSKPVK